MIIAIDGTLASGKGTLAKRLAAHYGLPHLDTGQLYRAVGISCLDRGVDLDDEGAVAKVAREMDLAVMDAQRLRTAEAGQAASRVAQYPKVRAAMVAYQRDFANQPGGAVLDGRDIGTVICPDAPVKFWVDAAIEERARRRWAELHASGDPITLDEMLAQLHERDERDRSRATAPMKAADDAHLLDTTHMSIDAVEKEARRIIDGVRAV